MLPAIVASNNVGLVYGGPYEFHNTLLQNFIYSTTWLMHTYVGGSIEENHAFMAYAFVAYAYVCRRLNRRESCIRGHHNYSQRHGTHLLERCVREGSPQHSGSILCDPLL